MTIKTRFPSIEPSLDLNFAATKRLDPRITFTRASSATFVNEDGLIEAAGVNQARFDHTPTTGESLGLLVEEQRTNLILQSEDFSTTWTNVNTSEAINVATAPDGTTTADKLITNNGIAGISSYIAQTVVKSAAATTYTYSVFAKTGEAGTGTLQLLAVDTATSANSATSSFSTVSGTIAVAASVNGTFANASSIITPLADGWYRCSLTFTTGTETSINLRLYSRLPTTGDGTRGILLWGAQLEVGAFPTSYIPTVAATVTRAADVASITGANFSSWYNQTEGTMFADVLNTAVIGTTRIFSVSNNANANRIHINRGSVSGGNIGVVVTTSSVAQVGLTLATSLAALTSNKSAFAYKTNDFAGSVNGLTPVTQNTGSIPTVSQATIGNGDTVGLNTMNGTIKRLTYWPTRLADTTLQQITQ